MEELSALAIGLISGLGGSLMVAFTLSYYNKRTLQSNTFTTIFKMLSEKEHWEARKSVLKSYKEFIKNEKPNMSLFDEEQMRIVRSDFDQIGMLIYKEIIKEQIGDDGLDHDTLGISKGFIPKKLFFEGFSGSVINSWYALEYIIKFQRHHINSDRFMLFFEQLFEDAKKSGEFKSKLRQEREENSKLVGKLEKWINEIPNQSPDEIEKIQNY